MPQSRCLRANDLGRRTACLCGGIVRGGRTPQVPPERTRGKSGVAEWRAATLPRPASRHHDLTASRESVHRCSIHAHGLVSELRPRSLPPLTRHFPDRRQGWGRFELTSRSPRSLSSTSSDGSTSKRGYQDMARLPKQETAEGRPSPHDVSAGAVCEAATSTCPTRILHLPSMHARPA